MDLGDHEVLVVARIRDEGPAPLGDQRAGADPGQVEAAEGQTDDLVVTGSGQALGRAGAQAQAVVLVETAVEAVLRTEAVEAVEVQRRGAALEELSDGDVLLQLYRRGVQGQVVVDELAEVGEARGHRRVVRVGLGAGLGHRLREFLAGGPVEQLGGLGVRAQPGELELAQSRDGRRRRRLRGALVPGVGEDALADHEVRGTDMAFGLWFARRSEHDSPICSCAQARHARAPDGRIPSIFRQVAWVCMDEIRATKSDAAAAEVRAVRPCLWRCAPSWRSTR